VSWLHVTRTSGRRRTANEQRLSASADPLDYLPFAVTRLAPLTVEFAESLA
jgi:hypothetical protein